MEPVPHRIMPAELRCFLCSSDARRTVWRLTGLQVRALWKVLDRHLSEAAFGPLTAECDVVQFECCSCGFRFFNPVLAGGSMFYEELEKDNYYVERRPEFDFALTVCAREKADSVLDVGGGEGAFLDLARAEGMTTFGLELNPRAAAVAAGKGHRTLNKLLEDVSARDLDGGVQVLTLFQVLEHVPDPRAFIRHCTSLVKKGGIIVVAVPNDRGVHRLLPFDPANMPPHHVSRWRRRDLEYLGETSGLTVFARGADPLYGRGLQDFWLLHNRLAEAIDAPLHPGGQWLPETVSWFYRKLGARHYLPRWGLSIYVAYRKS